MSEIPVTEASKSLLDGFREVVPSLLDVFGVFTLSKLTSALWSVITKIKTCGWMKISNMSRISVFNLSLDIRAETADK